MRRFLSVIIVALAAAIPVMQASPAAARSAPSSCVKALDAADELRSQSAAFTQKVADFFGAVHDNASSNSDDASAFIDQLTSDISDLGDAATTATPGIRDASNRLTTYEARCRGGR